MKQQEGKPANERARRKAQHNTATARRNFASRNRRTSGRGAKKGRKISVSSSQRWFSALDHRNGFGASLQLVERRGTHYETVRHDFLFLNPFDDRAKGVRPVNRSAGRRSASAAARTFRAFAALGHSQRIRILGRLLQGQATYDDLKLETGLSAGPLYHHIHQLRLAGCMQPKRRNAYEISSMGRNLYLIAGVLCSVLKKPRDRTSGS